MVALEAATAPLRRLGAVVVGGFSDAWHLLTCLDNKSLAEEISGRQVRCKCRHVRTFLQTDHHNADICMVYRRYLWDG